MRAEADVEVAVRGSPKQVRKCRNDSAYDVRAEVDIEVAVRCSSKRVMQQRYVSQPVDSVLRLVLKFIGDVTEEYSYRRA